MKLIFVTSCKPTKTEKIQTMQMNSLRSWIALEQEKEIYVFNRNDSVKEMCKNLKVTIVEEYESSSHSDIPTWRTMRNFASKISNDDDVIVWVNSDVMFNNSLIKTIQGVVQSNNENFVLVGQKYDWSNFYDLENNFDLSSLSPLAKHGEYAIDYFIFKKQLFENVPEFFIARQKFDNFLLTKAIKEYFAIDCTNTLLCVHHRHDYGPEINLPFHKAHSTNEWQNEQRINDNLMTVQVSSILNCKNYTSFDEDGNIKIKNK